MKQTAKPAPKAPAIQPAAGPLQLQRCACGGAAGPSGECAECQKKLSLQRKEKDAKGAERAMAPPIVHDVLRSPGRPLEPEARGSMEHRLGHDFGRVRVHTDAQAVESAAAVGALAYTVGHKIVFGRGQYAPGSAAGQTLLAHELVHTMQQGNAEPQGPLPISRPGEASEREAEALSQGSAGPVLAEPAHVARQSRTPALCFETARWPGNFEHAAVEGDYAANVNRTHAALEYQIPGGGLNGSVGWADMVDLATYAIYEIKTWAGAEEGVRQAGRYLAAAEVHCDPDAPWHLGTAYPPRVIPMTPDREIVARQYPQFPGVVVYYTRRRRRVPEPVPQRSPAEEREEERRRSREQAPGQVPAPALARQSTLQLIANFIQAVAASGEDAVAAARRFVADHPEVRDLLIAGAITIVVATLIEDIATLGAGLADDPASFAVAFALVRVAQSGR